MNIPVYIISLVEATKGPETSTSFRFGVFELAENPLYTQTHTHTQSKKKLRLDKTVIFEIGFGVFKKH